MSAEAPVSTDAPPRVDARDQQTGLDAGPPPAPPSDAGPVQCPPCPARPNASVSCQAGQCVYQCEQGFAACAGEASTSGCISTMDSGQHCGGCGFSCRGSLCVAGVCEPTRISVRPSPNLGTITENCTLRDGWLYWADRDAGAVAALSTTGAPPRQLFSGRSVWGSDNGGIYLDGPLIYWSTVRQGSIALDRMPVAGGAIETLPVLTDQISASGMTAVGGGFVWRRYLGESPTGWRYAIERKSSGSAPVTAVQATVNVEPTTKGSVFESAGLFWTDRVGETSEDPPQ